jgi:murein DD-endopeptidase MepM/ murein hydrolase activator NlpD
LATQHRPYVRTSRRRPRLPGRALLVGAAVAGLLATGSAAVAAPGDAASQQQGLAAEVAQIEERVRAADEQLQRMTIEAEAAADAALVARAELATAEAEADRTAAELADAQAAVVAAEEDIASLGREAYMGSDDRYGDIELLLNAESPTELLQQATTMEHLGDHRAARLHDFLVVEQRVEDADLAAKAAVTRLDEVARVAEEAEAAANAHLAEAQAEFDRLAAEKAALDEELRQAGERLLAEQGAADPAAAWTERTERQAVATATGGTGSLVDGRTTSCYGARWGTMHQGVDIAAPIGTPIFVPEDGVVLQAGPASGFGQAVYVQHGDGQITLYGHVNRFFVGAGDVVTAGQQIAEVGNKGQSTGPHLHFEVHQGGLYASRVNPVPWLTAHGVSVSC